MGSKGVERITERGLVANGKLHEVDCIVFASGFDASADADPSSGFDIIGRGDVRLHNILSGA